MLLFATIKAMVEVDICKQHEDGFLHAIHKAIFLFGISDVSSFDIDKDV